MSAQITRYLMKIMKQNMALKNLRVESTEDIFFNVIR